MLQVSQAVSIQLFLCILECRIKKMLDGNDKMLNLKQFVLKTYEHNWWRIFIYTRAHTCVYIYAKKMRINYDGNTFTV